MEEFQTITLIVKSKVPGTKCYKQEPIGAKFPGCATIKQIMNWKDEKCVNGVEAVKIIIPLEWDV